MKSDFFVKPWTDAMPYAAVFLCWPWPSWGHVPPHIILKVATIYVCPKRFVMFWNVYQNNFVMFLNFFVKHNFHFKVLGPDSETLTSDTRWPIGKGDSIQKRLGPGAGALLTKNNFLIFFFNFFFSPFFRQILFSYFLGILCFFFIRFWWFWKKICQWFFRHCFLSEIVPHECRTQNIRKTIY